MIRAVRLGFVLLLAWWTCRFIAYPMREDVIGTSVVHLPDLIFHEAGHILFSPFGDFMMTLGGSLMQVMVPIVCAVAFLTTSRDHLHRSEEHTSELQSPCNLVCRLLLEKKKKKQRRKSYSKKKKKNKNNKH